MFSWYSQINQSLIKKQTIINKKTNMAYEINNAQQKNSITFEITTGKMNIPSRTVQNPPKKNFTVSLEGSTISVK